MKLLKIGVRLILVFLSIWGCSSNKNLRNNPEFKIYRAKSEKYIARLPVIIVPGIKGSILKENKKIIWGHSWRNWRLPTINNLKLELGPQLNENFDSQFKKYYHSQKKFSNGDILENFWISLPGIRIAPAKIYAGLIEFLEDEGGYTINKDLFKFSYDWRLDNRIAAISLGHKVIEVQTEYKQNFIEKNGKYEWEKFVKNGKENDFVVSHVSPNDTEVHHNVKVIIVAHSMGGLVARYYLQALGGHKNTHSLITFATPNKGGMDAIKAIIKGEYFESVLKFYDKEDTRPILFSWPSFYQLLPRYKEALKSKDGQTLNLADWGLSDQINEENIENAISNWGRFGLLPSLSPIKKEIQLKYLREQLESATYFYRTINGKCGKEIGANKYDLEDRERTILKKYETLREAHEVSCYKDQVPTRYILFGGNCKGTLTYAEIENNDRVKKISFPKDPEMNVRQRIYYYSNISHRSNYTFDLGDGRVPSVSLSPLGRENNRDFTFFLCEDHVGIVDDQTFKYNCLREILRHTNRFNGIEY